jgi:hypothetical protein
VMRVAGATVGSRGIVVLGTAAAVGIVLAVHGWSVRHNGSAPGLKPSLAGPAAAASSSAPAGPPAHSSPPRSQSPAPASSAPVPGPRLRAQSYASYSYRVWPGPVSSAAKAAGTGLAITVRQDGSGIMVTAGVAGQPPQPARFYPTGTAVYVVEATMGDDSGNSDYNLGDDGLVVTDSQGRILQ